MTTQTREKTRETVDKGRKQVTDTTGGLMSQLPVDRLRSEVQGLGQALGKQGLAKVGVGVEGLTQRLSDYAEGKPKAKAAKNVAQGDSALKTGAKFALDTVKDKAGQVKDKVGETLGNLGSGGGSGGKKLKVTNIVESIDVPVSREVAYEQWTQFEEFPTFMKKVESVKQEEDEVVTWQAQVFWSHRTWKATILDQVPNEHILWKSESEKGRVDGAVTFHELAPNLTRILVSLEYHPKGLFEHTGNLWRAQGRRVRLEMRHFRRHVANYLLIHQDELEGWKGEIHNKKVTDDGSGEEEPGKDAAADEAETEDENSRSGDSDSGSGSDSASSGRSGATKKSSKKAPSKSAKKPASTRSNASAPKSAKKSAKKSSERSTRKQSTKRTTSASRS